LFSIPDIAARRTRAEPFPVAPDWLAMRDWNVSSEPAFRRPRGSDESAEASSTHAREHLNAVRSTQPAEPAAATNAEAQARSLRFEDVFREHAPYVGALVLKLTGRPGDVDDVVQDVFMQAHRGLKKLRDPAAVRPWLRRITVRRTRRWLRKRWVLRWFLESDVDAHADLVDPAASPEDRTSIAYIYRTLEKMSEDERLVWVLRFVEGETLESIAELLGASISTVQRRLRTAQTTMGEIR
jgi:RNA polymerase sigma-70 factor (ECF subfamily)